MDLQERIALLEKEKMDLSDKLDKAQAVISVFDTETMELIRYMKENHISEGKWVKIKWYQIGKWWELGKRCFTYVKNVMKAFGVKIEGIDKLLEGDKQPE